VDDSLSQCRRAEGDVEASKRSQSSCGRVLGTLSIRLLADTLCRGNWEWRGYNVAPFFSSKEMRSLQSRQHRASTYVSISHRLEPPLLLPTRHQRPVIASRSYSISSVVCSFLPYSILRWPPDPLQLQRYSFSLTSTMLLFTPLFLAPQRRLQPLQQLSIFRDVQLPTLWPSHYIHRERFVISPKLDRGRP